MSRLLFTEATPGLPNSGRVSGTAGDLYALLKYALPLNGWAVEYDDPGNFTCVLRPGTGNRFRLFVADNATVSGDARKATMRGCENATGASTSDIVDPWPLVTSLANDSAVWLKSTNATTAARNFNLIVEEAYFWLHIDISGSGNGATCDLYFFGDYSPSLIGDSYNTAISSRAVATFANASTFFASNPITAMSGTNTLWNCRSYDGTIKSTRAGIPNVPVNGNIGAISNAPAYGTGPTTGLDTVKAGIMCNGSSSTTPSASALPIRGWLPDLLLPLHGGRGAAAYRDTYQNTPVDPAFVGTIFTNGTSATSQFLALQTAGNWIAPSG